MDNKTKYSMVLQNGLSTVINTCMTVRRDYATRPNECIQALDLCIKALQEAKRGIMFFYNTNPQIPPPPPNQGV